MSFKILYCNHINYFEQNYIITFEIVSGFLKESFLFPTYVKIKRKELHLSSSNNNIFMNLIDDDNPAGEERRDVLGPRHDPRRPIRKLAPRCSRLEPLKKPILGNSDSGNLKIIVQL